MVDVVKDVVEVVAVDILIVVVEYEVVVGFLVGES